MIPFRSFVFALICAPALVMPVHAQEKPPLDPLSGAQAPTAAAPYDDKLLRLAEVIGSVHYLRNLCKAPGDQDWRRIMQQVLHSETKGEDLRRERLTAAFNRGYRTFASVYSDCTPAALVAEERYRNEGATLAAEITSRFGN